VALVVENVPLARDHRLRKQVSALRAAGIGVSVICPADPGNTRVAGVSLYAYRAPASASSRLGFLVEYGISWGAIGWQLLRAFRRERFDAIQIAGNPDIYFTLAVPFRWLGRRLVFDQRDPAPELYTARYGAADGSVLRLLRMLERTSYRAADHVLVVNESLRAMATGRGGQPERRVSIVGNGPILRDIARAEVRPELTRGRRHLAVWAGLMGRQDSVELALRAAAHLVHQLGRTDCTFTFIGDGESRPALQELAAELGVRDWVDFPGWLDEPAAFSYLATADVGLEPNLEAIVSPVKVQEYMAFGLPVVAFDLPETRRLAAGAAALVPPGDVAAFAAAVDRLLAAPACAAELGRAGRQRVADDLAWERQQQNYLRVWQDLLPPQSAGLR
jgi:glycosyltransferase involved in cell wall biosynthesis